VTGLGAIQGAVAANVKVMGCYSDQTDLAPNNIATSFVMNLRGMVITIGRQVSAGTFTGGTEWGPPVNEMWLLRCGKIGDYNPRLVTAEEWSAFQKVWADIAAGKIDINSIVA